MLPIDQKLFSDYCSPILQNAENFDEAALKALLAPLRAEQGAEDRLIDALFDCYRQWSLDAFAVGLHLGLSISLHGDVRCGRPQ